MTKQHVARLTTVGSYPVFKPHMYRIVLLGLLSLALCLVLMVSPGLGAKPDIPGGDSWSSNGPYGGYIHSLARAPSNPDIIFAGTEAGVFKSTDNGATWGRVGHPHIPVYAIQVSPADPQIVIAGSEDGVYKSIDGGITWVQRGIAGGRVNALAIDPQNADIIYAGAGQPRIQLTSDLVGIYKSVDGGETWQPKSTNRDKIDAVVGLIVDPIDSNYVYAGIFAWWDADDGFLKSSDSGETWDFKHVAFDDWNDEDVFTIAMTAGNVNPPAIYAISFSGETDVYKSINRGESWSPCNTGWEIWDYPAALAVDPVQSNIIYAGAWLDKQMYRSQNSCQSWTPIVNGLPPAFPTTISIDPRNQQVLVGLEEGGICKSTNKGDDWQAAHHGMINTHIKGIAVHPANSSATFGAIQGQGHNLAATTDGGWSWNTFNNLPANLGAVAYDPQNGNTVYAGEGYEYHDKLNLHKTTNNGGSWYEQTLLTISGGYLKIGVSDILVSAVDSNIVLAAVDSWGGSTGVGGVYRSWNGGWAWTRQLKLWTNSLAADPTSPDIVYAGTQSCGHVYRSEDTGRTWENITQGPNPGDCWVAVVRDLEVNRDARVYAVTSSGLFVWDGVNWYPISGLPDEPLLAVAIDRSSDQGTLYVGTSESGVYVSEDSGQSWSPFNEGLGEGSIEKLGFSYGDYSRLYAGLSYGGVWTYELGPGSPTLSEKLYIPLVENQ